MVLPLTAMKRSLPSSPYAIQSALDRKEKSERENGMNSTLFVAMTRFCSSDRQGVVVGPQPEISVPADAVK